MAWVLLLASAFAVLLTGLAATALVLHPLTLLPSTVIPGFLGALAAAAGLTIASLGLRALRWIFLLRRTETRIPIRDAYIGYFAGLSLLLAPLLLGEIAVRAYVNKVRGRVPVLTTAVVNLWERLLDAVALAAVAGTFMVVSGGSRGWSIALLGFVALTLVGPARRLVLDGIVAVAQKVTRLIDDERAGEFGELAADATWLTALPVSIGAWLLPGVGLWGIAAVWGSTIDLARAEIAYASSTLAGGVSLAPGGVVVAGARLLAALASSGLSDTEAALSVVGVRLATVGLSTVLGGLFLLIHARTRPTTQEHFDQIAAAYDVQIPERRRLALLARKTGLMREILAARHAGPRGLDVGCGQGWYVGRMRELGFDVTGIDSSAGQLEIAQRHVGREGLVSAGSVLSIPGADGSYDFAYTINVLHHLSSVGEQRAAFAEILRVLKPGGLLFVHEINTRNILFRFYMGYVFPSLNCIDEGIERWLLPQRLETCTGAPVVDMRYFTFLPEFVPQSVADALAPLERALERSPLGAYSAHYMAVIQKPLT